MKHTIDAKDKILGRVASEVAVILQGKKHANYQKNLAGNDEVLVKNVAGLKFSGRKFRQKVYYSHSAYMGHLKETRLSDLFVKAPEKVLWNAVYHMLPKNRLRKLRLGRLKIEK